jgi:hypothetical protein
VGAKQRVDRLRESSRSPNLCGSLPLDSDHSGVDDG